MRTSVLWIATAMITSGQAVAQPAPPGAVQITPAKPRMRPASVPRAGTVPPGGTVLGVPVRPNAPVSPPYDGTAYKTLGGQAETGADAIAGQSMGTAPR